MKKIILSALLTGCFLYALCAGAYSQDNSDLTSMNSTFSELGLDHDDLVTIKDLLDNRSTPVITDVSADPSEPGEDEPVEVKANIMIPFRPNGDQVYEVFINYTTDGGETVSQIEMARDMESGDSWSGTIPGQPSGTEVLYGIQAVSSFDEIATETICESGVSPDCMLPMSISSRDPYSREYARIPDELKIKSTKVGVDDTKISLEMDMVSAVAPGSLSPMNVNIYVAGWLNLDKLTSETGIDAILKQGAAVIYSPLNISDKCALYYFLGTDIQSDYRPVTCHPDNDRLTFMIDKAAVEPNPSKTLEFAIMTLRMLALSPVDVELQDITLFTKVIFNSRSYTVR